MIISTYASSLVGHREENQDRYIVVHSAQCNASLVIVADGMGGHHGGAEAAQAVIDASVELWRETPSFNDPKAFLLALVERAEQAVKAIQQGDFAKAQTTFCALFVNGEHIMSVHLGDSRVIQVDERNVIKRTVDHSLAQIQVLQGKISEDEIATHPDQNKLFANVGSDKPGEPEIETFAVMPGRLIVCSDGFWELFRQAELPAFVMGIDSDAQLSQQIQALIDDRNGHDNTTAVIVEIKNEGSHEAAPMKSATINTTRNSRLIGMVLLIAGVVMIFAASLFLIPEESQNTDKSPQSNQDADANQPEAPPPETKEPQPASPAGQQPSKDTRENKEQVGLGEETKDRGLPTTRSDVNIPVSSDEEAVEKTSDHLQQQGQLSEDDALAQTGESKRVGDTRVIRMQQHHKGIPVYGADILAVVKDDVIDNIAGKTANNILVNTTPSLSLEEAIVIAEAAIGSPIRRVEPGQLVIFKRDDIYILSWLVKAQISLAKNELLFISSDDGYVIERIPLFFDQPGQEE